MPLSLLIFPVVLVLPWMTLGAIEKIQVRYGESVVLKCNISLHHEIFWLKVSMEERPRLLMIAGLKNDGELSEIWNYNSSHFEGCLVGRFFGLRITYILNSDLASYYCGIVNGKHMEFEEGVYIYENPVQPWTDTNTDNVTNYEKELTVAVNEQRHTPYRIFAATLAVGLLGMVLTVLVVHIITWKK